VRGGRYVVTVVAASMLAAGCGTTAARTPPSAGTLAAAVTRTGTQTARIAATVTVKSTGMTTSFDINGAFDFTRSRGMLAMPAPIGLTELFVPPKLFIKIPGTGTAVPHGKTWVEVDPAGAASALGPFAAVSDPADVLATLAALAGSQRTLGAGTVRGVPVTGYQLNIDPATAASKAPAGERVYLGQLFKSLGKGAIPVDVWVDAQHLVRQIRLSVRLPGGTGAAGNSQLTVTIDLYDFGAPVRVSAPPAAQVASMSQMISDGSSSYASGFASASAPAVPGSPPAVSGSLTPGQAQAAGQAVAAFWAALGRNDPAAVARTVLPAQASCVAATLQNAPTFTLSGFRIVSVQPAGNGRATVRYTVNAAVSFGGKAIAVTPPGGGVQWSVADERAGHWYVDVSTGSENGNVGAGPCQ
jgi:hypothetical protein